MAYENENEQINSDVIESPSETQESSAHEPAPKAAAPAESDESKQPDSERIPYNRFKEVVEQKNQFAEQVKSFEQRYAQMEAQLKQLSTQSQAKKEQDALISRLKGIDPEFGERFEKLDATQKELAELREWRQQVEMESMRTQAVSMVKDLHSSNKVPADLQDLYNTQLELAAARNPNMTVKDIPALYKSVHERITKLTDGIRRAERESYVSGKTADAKVPTSQPKGKAVEPSNKFEYSKDPEEARKQMISRIVKQSKASNSL